MKISVNIGGKEFGLTIGAGVQVKTPNSAFLAGADLDSYSGRGATLAEPYAQSVWIYSCINIIAKNLMQIPFRISRGADKSEDIIESGPVVDLFEHPHPTMDRALFWANLVSWDCLRGEFFILPLDLGDQPVDLSSRRTIQIKQLLTLDPAMLWHNVSGYELMGWRYTGSPLLSPLPSQVLLPTEVIHARSFNPYLYWRGLSPLVVALLAAQTDYASAQFMKGLMLNNADTGVIVTTDQQPSNEQREQILAALRDRKRKAGTADRPLFLWGGSTVQKPTVSSADLQFLANRELNRQEIGAIYGVSDMMLGFSKQRTLGTGAGAEQERYNFIESTITPLCRRLEAAVAPIVKSFGPDLVGWFDVDSLPVMQEARRTRVDTAVKVFGMGVPFNEINQVYDLGFTDFTWGDKGYLPFNLQEAGANTPEADDLAMDPNAAALNPFAGMRKLLRDATIPGATPGNTGATPVPPKHVCAATPEFETSIAGSIKIKRGKISRFFFEQRGRVLAKLAGEIKSQKSEASKSLDDIFNKAAEDLELLKKLKPLLLADLEFGGAQVFAEISSGIDFNLKPKDAIAFLDKRENVIKDINATTWDRIKSELQSGLGAGESFDAMADRVRAVYDAASGARADMIALTETTVATNSGRMNAMLQAGVERKGWRTSHLENTRDTHWANEILTREENGIPIADLWPNGCAFPGDPDGEPGETINCRCFGFALKVAPPKNFRLLQFEEWYAKRFPSPPAPEPKAASAPTPAPVPPPPPQIINVNVTLPSPGAKKLTLQRDAQGRITGGVTEETK